MSNDQELFDLSKEVEVRTGWKGVGKQYVNTPQEPDKSHRIYTSDYVLEKLPNDVILKKTEDGDYRAYAPKTVPINSILSDTPLKALLKLVIALDDAGVKL